MTDTEAIQLPVELAESESEDEPLVSVLIASYEGERSYFERLFQSLVDQPYTSLECVLVDSSHQSFLRATAEETKWITYIPSEPEGVAAGTNEAVANASGEILAILDDDDYVTKYRFPRTVEAIRKGADVVYGDVYDLDDTTGEMTYRTAMVPDDSSELWIDFFRFDGISGSVPAGTVAFRAECVGDEPFHETLDGGEDYHLWVRLFEKYDVDYIAEPLAVMRQHDDSLSSDPVLMYENRIKAIDLLIDDYPELQRYAEERKQLERYDYGRNLMFNDELKEARDIFIGLMKERYFRAIVMAIITLLPTGHEWITRGLDKLRTRLISLAS